MTYTPVVRSGANPGATTAFGWFVDGRPDAAQRAVDKLDADTAMRALTAATDMAIALGARLNQLRAAALPKRAAEPCGYCGRTDCEQRFDHDRLDRGHEVTAWRKWAKR